MWSRECSPCYKNSYLDSVLTESEKWSPHLTWWVGLGCKSTWSYLMESVAWGLNIMLTSVVFGLPSVTANMSKLRFQMKKCWVSSFSLKNSAALSFSCNPGPSLPETWGLEPLVVSLLTQGSHSPGCHARLQSPWSRGRVSGVHFPYTQLPLYILVIWFGLVRLFATPDLCWELGVNVVTAFRNQNVELGVEVRKGNSRDHIA